MLAYQRYDVFTDQPFGGNQLAVFINPGELATETMQAIAREFNLAEITFVTPAEKPENHYRVRIFTPTTEMPTAGHPTIGTAYALLREGLVQPGVVRLEENIGVVPVTISQTGDFTLISMQQVNPTFGAVIEDRAAAAGLLGLTADDLMEDKPVQVVATGVPFLFIPVKTLSAMGRIRVRADRWEDLQAPARRLACSPSRMETELPRSTVHSRMFAPELGIVEDPATGIASGALGSYLVKYGLVTPSNNVASIVSEQGVEMGRPSIIQIRIETAGDQIVDVDVGGTAVYMGSGMLQV
ncbi:MAG: PhzF family phenazine biosynthesis protein [Chloroflexi bacterium]|nr:PhzF family phenazine biosynthesis protein [Chloroflexota bacterium]